MEPTLDEALVDLFPSRQASSGVPQATPSHSELEPALDQARTLFEDARRAMEKGEWTTFGTAMQGLQQQLAGPAAHH